ncbi:TPA: helix-turn-helix domain-containing protein [Clostridium perfringens]|uniref:helix-turn-helix domain-containing protein n=1 Tax=Clostridium perfringens TaxID=1502 RepID=UPI001A2F42A0|nr:helix-turn-helix transcriptional regulator [Clostridium perfringens]MCX0408799.1 helix-turn-helix transcriptional regulator [Clostridium perfringens]MDK0610397.1 helix-turn-helix transcriptional regulator [Clostridium perfringens]MDM0758136.1 helix-turn-helix transcriptional regulator [Clostridium perfringens]MDM0760081.1 helix-turn-helix transcriptional regulator [Clostridium perfringens]MDM0995649.1 helix-turn-helix transcriptional regulator [Clostridium perfringens]
MKKIANKLKEERLKKKVTLQQLENEINISATYLYRIENNMRNDISVRVLKKLSEFYKLDLNELINSIT